MKPINKKLLLIGLIITLGLLGLSLTGCSGYGTPSTTATSPQPASGNSVSISNFSFSPSTLTVKAGTTITWTNNDSTTHTIVSDSGVFNSGNLAPGKTFSYTFNTAGTFSYHCSIHPYMKGTITVQ